MSDLKQQCISVADRVEEACEMGELYEFIDDVVEIEYTISGNGIFLGARLAVTLGGPNIYINTRNGLVEGYWGGEQMQIPIDRTPADELYYITEEMYNSIK